MLDLPNKYLWDPESTVAFTEKLASDECKLKVDKLLSSKNMKMEDIKDLIMDTANDSQIKKTTPRTTRYTDGKLPNHGKKCEDRCSHFVKKR